MKNTFLTLLACAIIGACSSPEPADLILFNGNIYTVDNQFSKAEAVVMRDGEIIYVGNNAGADNYQGERIDLNGKTVLPGLQEGHAHIMGIGNNLQNVDLLGTTSYQEVIEMVKERASKLPEGTWILGRGWHQDKWKDQPERMFRNMPTHYELSEAVPNHPVWLKHASGHMALANAAAMELAGIDGNTPNPDGGEVFKELGSPTGIFNETAQGLIASNVPANTKEVQTEALELAIQECLKNGITGFHQAGSNKASVDLFQEFGKQDKLKIRLYTMLSGSDPEVLNEYFNKGPQVGLHNNHLWIRSVKLYADGALGSRGAWLIDEYADAPGETGHIVTPMSLIEEIATLAHSKGFQVCTHAIGDRANREVLDIYEKIGDKNARMRIEHAQHIDPEDIPRFASLGVIPAMQAIHMSSDRPWAIERLGKQRIIDGAYMWQKLLDSGAKIVNGTDAPVEPINPFACYYASVTRKTLQGTPDGGYEPTQKMTREQALRSYTIDAAYGAFMEKMIGSIEVGKRADLVVIDRDIITVPEEEILSASVKMTLVDGVILYSEDE